jgi:hypothetical protein
LPALPHLQAAAPRRRLAWIPDILNARTVSRLPVDTHWHDRAPNANNFMDTTTRQTAQVSRPHGIRMIHFPSFSPSQAPSIRFQEGSSGDWHFSQMLSRPPGALQRRKRPSRSPDCSRTGFGTMRGALPERFRAADVRRTCPGWADHTYGVLLPKHRRGNPDGFTEYFDRHPDGSYSLIEQLSKQRKGIELLATALHAWQLFLGPGELKVSPGRSGPEGCPLGDHG